MRWITVLFFVFVSQQIVLAQGQRDEFYQSPDATRALGPNFSRNLPRVLRRMRDLHSLAIQILVQHNVSEELNLSDKQTARLRAAKDGQPEPQEIFLEVMGSKSPRAFGRLEGEGLEGALDDIQPIIDRTHKHIRKEIEETLTAKQLRRFKQIYLQESLVLRHFRRADLTGFDWMFTPEQQAQLEEGIKKADIELKERFDQLRFEAYADVISDILGKQEAKEKLGKRFDVRAMPIISEGEDFNRRRGRTNPPR